jgi:hypothetical protein
MRFVARMGALPNPEGVPAQRVTDLEGMLKALGARFPRT